MKNRFEVRLYNDLEYYKPLRAFYEELCHIIDFPQKEAKELEEAMWELFKNAVIHGYGDEEGIIEVEFELFENGMKIDVKDKGLPFDERIFKTVPLDPKAKNRGLNRVFFLTDSFRYFNLGLGGKKFSIVKYTPLPLRLKEDIPFYSDIGTEVDESLKAHLKERLVVRDYQEGDEVAISRLIYKNYGYTYFKDLFYYPEKIRQKEGKEIYSIVAEIEGEVVGHFALVKVPNSNIAEIGIAVVDPGYKGMGIMKEMFRALLQKAQDLGLGALFGEAITFHPYSQKANARFGFFPTALQLGEVHQMVRLKGHRYPFRNKRGATLVDYKVFDRRHKRIAMPKRYEEWIKRAYDGCGVPFEMRGPGKEEERIAIEHNPTFGISTIVIDNAGVDFKDRFVEIFEEAMKKHPQMLYADINLEEIGDIQKSIDVLRSFGFFYCGVLFLRRGDKDYLRMQLELSENIEEQNIVCYTDMCKDLHRFILEDKRSVAQ